MYVLPRKKQLNIMTVVRWKMACRFSIFLALLYMRETDALNANIDAVYTPYRPPSDTSFNIIDMTQQQDEMRPSESGQTSRFYTNTDDLDETFWIKQLGNDYKNAIHMQVAVDDPRNMMFGISENGNGSAPQPPPIIQSQNPVIESEIKLPITEEGVKNKKNNGMRKRLRKLKNDKKIEKVEKSMEKNANPINDVKSQPAKGNTLENSDKSLDIMAHKDIEQYTNFQDINMKYEPERNNNETYPETQTSQNDTRTTYEQAIAEASNLPKTNKGIEEKTKEASVPSVIFNGEATNMTTADGNNNDNPKKQTSISISTQQDKEEISTDGQIQIGVDNKQLRPEIVSSVANDETKQQKQGQYIAFYTQYAPQLNQEYSSQPIQYMNIQQQQQQQQQQPQQHIQYPVNIQTAQYQETIPYNQPIQYNNQQNRPPSSYTTSSSNYHDNSVSMAYHQNHGVYPPTITSAPTYVTLPTVLDPRHAKAHYINLPATASYDAQFQGAAPPTQPEYKRANRSNRQLYQEGL